jgi:putative heme-binding domain-containing protein
VLLSRAVWAELLLAAVERDEVPRGDIDPARVELLRSHPSSQVRDRAAAVFRGATIPRRVEVVAEYQRSLELAGEVERGRTVFQKSCAACHALEGAGTPIGADLRAVRDRGAAAVLLNILDPNREIQPNFLTYIVVTKDGRAITGIITAETPNHLTLRQADGTAVDVPRADIDEMRSTGLSYMPEGLETQIDHQAMADLLAYLMTVDSSGESGAKSGD